MNLTSITAAAVLATVAFGASAAFAEPSSPFSLAQNEEWVCRNTQSGSGVVLGCWVDVAVNGAHTQKTGTMYYDLDDRPLAHLPTGASPEDQKLNRDIRTASFNAAHRGGLQHEPTTEAIHQRTADGGDYFASYQKQPSTLDRLVGAGVVAVEALAIGEAVNLATNGHGLNGDYGYGTTYVPSQPYIPGGSYGGRDRHY